MDCKPRHETKPRPDPPSHIFIGKIPESLPDGVANPVRQNQS
ncbi:Uncharacterized protein dnm_055490 [Desulfonema magnum]|uniref:Uncharacterized protein n=1 Tax=Desulfonema magnum TaxID=45655 RepID=A0A975BQF9_9BACT|nr:Uncharacterized protein dnm_055490 [Desulfonema magnum]